MVNFFRSLLKNKRTLFFVLLFFVLGGIILPASASASWWGDIIDAILYLPERIGSLFVLMVIALPLKLLSSVFQLLATMSYNIFAYVLNQMIRDPQNVWTITQNEVFKTGWQIVKAWANMVIVLGLIGIATATILRLREFEAKKLLPMFIGVALLINFSVVFIGVMIDVSNVVMRSLTSGAERHGNIILDINGAWNDIVAPLYARAIGSAFQARDWSTPIAAALTYASAEFIFAIIYLVIAVTLFLITIVFIERYIALAILFIASPLAFVFLIFPFSRGLFSKWWQHFLKWCFAGLVAAFALRISTSILAMTSTSTSWQTAQGNLITSAMPRIILQLLVVLGFLIAGYRYSKKSSVLAGMAINGAKATAGFVVGTVAGLASSGTIAGLKIAGATKAGGFVKDAYRQTVDAFKGFTIKAGERSGYYKPGALEASQKQAHEKELKKHTDLENIQDNGRLAQIRKSSNDVYQRSKIVDILAKRDALDVISASDRDGALNEAVHHGVSANEIAKKDADYSYLDTAAIHGEVAKNNLVKKYTDMGYSEEKAKEEAYKDAEGMVRRRNYEQQNDSPLKKMAKEDQITLGKQQGAKGAMMREILAENGMLNAKTMDMTDEEIAKLQNSDRKEYGSNVWKTNNKKNPLLAKYDEELRSEIIKDIPALKSNEAGLREEAIKRSVSKLTGDQFADLAPDVQKESTKYASTQVLERAIMKASTKGKEAIAEGILSDAENLTPERLKAALGVVPKNEIAGMIAKQSPEVKQKLKNIYAPDLVALAEREATNADVDKAEADDIKQLVGKKDTIFKGEYEGKRKDAMKKGLPILSYEDMYKDVFMPSEVEYKTMQEDAKKKGLPIASYKDIYRSKRDAAHKIMKSGGIMPITIPNVGDMISTTEEEKRKDRKKNQSQQMKDLEDRLQILRKKPEQNKKEIEGIENFLKSL